MFADTSRGRPFAKDPAVTRFGDRYVLYYSLPPFGDGRSQDGWRIGIAVGDDLDGWERMGEIAPVAPYEQNGLCAPGVLVLEGKVHLFYQTYGNGPRDAICHAVSEDGVHFERNPTNPIFRPHGEWNCGRAIDADVIPYAGRLWLYFATRDPSMQVQMLGVATAPLGSAFEREDWTQGCDGPILEPKLLWEQACIEAPALCRRGGRFFMFYAGAYNNAPQQIGCATSLDGIAWERLSDEPFLPNGGPGEWNASESGHPFLFVDEDARTHLFFQGNNDMGKSWYISRRTMVWEGLRPRLAGAPRQNH